MSDLEQDWLISLYDGQIKIGVFPLTLPELVASPGKPVFNKELATRYVWIAQVIIGTATKEFHISSKGYVSEQDAIEAMKTDCALSTKHYFRTVAEIERYTHPKHAVSHYGFPVMGRDRKPLYNYLICK